MIFSFCEAEGDVERKDPKLWSQKARVLFSPVLSLKICMLAMVRVRAVSST